MPSVRAKAGSRPAKNGAAAADNGTRQDAAAPLRTAGDQLRAELGGKGDPLSVTLLIRQAARVADRLEHIDALLAGREDSWATVSLPKSGSARGRIIVEMRVDNLLVEERNQSTLYRHLIGEIHRLRAGLPPNPDGDGDDDLVD